MNTAIRARRRLLTGSAHLVLTLLALGVIVLTTALDRVLVTSRAALSGIEFGRPLPWLTQDQSLLDPSFPSERTFLTPYAYPVDVAYGALLADVLIVYVVLAVLSAAVRLVLRGRVSPH